MQASEGNYSNPGIWSIRLVFWLPFLLLIGATHLVFIVLLGLSIIGIPLAHLHWRMLTLILYPLVIDDLDSRIAHFRAVSSGV